MAVAWRRQGVHQPGGVVAGGGGDGAQAWGGLAWWPGLQARAGGRHRQGGTAAAHSIQPYTPRSAHTMMPAGQLGGGATSRPAARTARLTISRAGWLLAEGRRAHARVLIRGGPVLFGLVGVAAAPHAGVRQHPQSAGRAGHACGDEALILPLEHLHADPRHPRPGHHGALQPSQRNRGRPQDGGVSRCGGPHSFRSRVCVPTGGFSQRDHIECILSYAFFCENCRLPRRDR